MHAHSGGKNSESFVCVHSNPQRHRLATSRYLALHLSTRLRCPPDGDVSAPTSTFQQFRPLSKLHAPPLLYYQQKHRLASRPPPPRINLARAIRFSSDTRSLLQHSPLPSVEHISATTPIYVRSSTATTTTTPSTRRHPTAPFGNAAPPTNPSSAITSL